MKPRYVRTHRSKDLRKSMLFVSRNIVDSLARSNEQKLNNLFTALHYKLMLSEKDFLFALNFLFILGVVDYDKSRDVIIFNK